MNTDLAHALMTHAVSTDPQEAGQALILAGIAVVKHFAGDEATVEVLRTLLAELEKPHLTLIE